MLRVRVRERYGLRRCFQTRRFSACDGWFPDWWRLSGSERRLLVEGHLTKHQAVTDADKKSDVAGLSPAAAAAATASAGLFGTRVGRLTRGRLNLTQVRRQQTTVRPTRRKKTKRVFGLAYTYG